MEYNSTTMSDAFERGHEKGFHAGYIAATQELCSILRLVEKHAAYPDDVHIKEKYDEIFRGFDEPSEAMKEVLGGVTA